MADNTLKIIEAYMENAVEVYEEQNMLLDLVERTEPDPAKLENSGNVIWSPVEQNRPVITGWDVSGQEQDIIEETYPQLLGTPENDLIEQRLDKVRDMQYWERAGRASGMRQAAKLNKAISDAIMNQGAIFYRSNATNGYDFIGEAQTLMNERQLKVDQRHFLLNDRDTKKFAVDLSNRETVKGRPESAWGKGQIGSQVAQFDIHTGSFISNLAGGADPATTVTGTQSFAPEGGSVNTTTNVVTNIDYREADIPVADSSGYNVGDKIAFTNDPLGTPTTVKALGLHDKTNTNQTMTFTIVGKPDGTTITVYPKPIAADDGGLTALEQAYANIDTQITNGAQVTRLNTDTLAKPNLFWNKTAVEVMTGAVPAELMQQWGGKKVISTTMKNGQKMYFMYDGDIKTALLTGRLFTWYGVTIANPSACGAAITF